MFMFPSNQGELLYPKKLQYNLVNSNDIINKPNNFFISHQIIIGVFREIKKKTNLKKVILISRLKLLILLENCFKMFHIYISIFFLLNAVFFINYINMQNNSVDTQQEKTEIR